MPVETHPRTRDLDAYLHQALNCNDHNEIKQHLATCEKCWQKWNRYRWDAASTTALYDDLKRFLGADFQPYFDSSHALAAEWDAANPRTPADVAAFFRASTSYLYNLVIWQASGHRPRYLSEALPALREYGVKSIVDFGCGVGNDAIPLQQQGFDVTGCDFTSPSTDFLRWRSRNTITVIEPEQIDAHPLPDALWLIDTIDHLDDIDATLGAILLRVKVLITENFSDHDNAHSSKRFHHRRPYTQISACFKEYELELDSARSNSTVMVWRRNECSGAGHIGDLDPALVAGGTTPVRFRS